MIIIIITTGIVITTTIARLIARGNLLSRMCRDAQEFCRPSRGSRATAAVDAVVGVPEEIRSGGSFVLCVYTYIYIWTFVAEHTMSIRRVYVLCVCGVCVRQSVVSEPLMRTPHGWRGLYGISGIGVTCTLGIRKK